MENPRPWREDGKNVRGDRSFSITKFAVLPEVPLPNVNQAVPDAVITLNPVPQFDVAGDKLHSLCINVWKRPK